MKPRYPVYVPSKGRWRDNQALTVKTLQRDEIPFRLVVEPTEARRYVSLLSERDNLLVLPFAGLGLGSIPARNWIREHAEAGGYARHWVLDDNLYCFYRLWLGRRVPVHAGTSLRVCEDFTDRFENVGVSGLAYDMFVIPFGGSGIRAPFFKNCHVYSAILVNGAMPFRWRGRFNEDTDLCLQALVNGWATLLVNAFTAKKVTTMTMGGGNTKDLYQGDDERDTMGRFEMARSLQRTWPGIVKLSRQYGRYTHSVDWVKFADVSLRLRDDVDLESLPEVDEYDLTLRTIREPKSERVRKLRDEYEEVLGATPAADGLWRGLPAFHPTVRPPKLVISFADPAAREQLVARLGVTVDKRYEEKSWAAWYPPRGRDDPAALRFEPREE